MVYVSASLPQYTQSRERNKETTGNCERVSIAIW